ncbi:MAG: dihydrofolate reductase [Acholeplasmatales bacterium]|nr:dihydrofolate reductase [Acholeplasmatales bacterium]
MIHLIWAMTKNHVIGLQNKMPWHIKEDLIYYKEHTAGKTVVMGENTYYSLKGYYKSKPLPYGKIYVASLNENLILEDAIVISDVIQLFKTTREDLWVVGGATIYQLALPYADALYISWVKKEYEGDTYFPEIDFTKFRNSYKKETDLVLYTIYERV